MSEVTLTGNHDVISVGFNCSSIIARTVHQIRQTFGGELNAVYSRQVLGEISDKVLELS